MSEEFLYKQFNEININDTFFDSLKKDYMEFESWFNKKNLSNEGAFIQLVDNSLQGFLYLKKETGPIIDVDPNIKCKQAIKIGTFKVNPHGTRLGERFIKKSIDYAINEGIDTIYVTIFSHHEYLLNMFKKFGFEIHGSKKTDNGTENVLVKSISNIKNNIFLDYPKINTKSNVFLLGIWPKYHTKLFPDSKLFTENFDVIRDVSHTNSISKIYIAKMRDMSSIKPGDNLVIYRTKDNLGLARYRSVVTTVCIVEDIKNINYFSTFNELKKYCKDYSIFSDAELNKIFNDNNTYYVIRMIYNVSLNKRIIQGTLIDELGINPKYWGLAKLTKEQFESILELGEVNKAYLI